MSLLLDTHALLWFSEDNSQLSPKAKQAIEDMDNTCFVSMASIWEIAIKISLGKLSLKIEFGALEEELKERNFVILPIAFEHTQLLPQMEFHHRDPFDRLLIAQALAEGLTLVSNEEVFDLYRIKRFW
jgi:PIN domain nuclease of toxin-antitoxin system